MRYITFENIYFTSACWFWCRINSQFNTRVFWVMLIFKPQNEILINVDNVDQILQCIKILWNVIIPGPNHGIIWLGIFWTILVKNDVRCKPLRRDGFAIHQHSKVSIFFWQNNSWNNLTKNLLNYFGQQRCSLYTFETGRICFIPAFYSVYFLLVLHIYNNKQGQIVILS